MSADGDQEIRHEVVIIRRRGGNEDEGHHGAAWKIAYADFMTAMMAFFLVMWLVNAASKKQVVEVAAYFNPIKLTDKVTSPKGVHKLDLGEAKEAADNQGAETKQDDQSKLKAKTQAAKAEASRDTSPDARKKPELADTAGQHLKAGGAKPDGRHGPQQQDVANEEMFRDPFGTLTRVAAEAASEQMVSGMPHEQLTRGLDASLDPFQPKVMRQRQPPVQPVETGTDDARPVLRKGGGPSGSEGASASAIGGRGADDVKKLAEKIEAAARGSDIKKLPAIEVTRIAEGVLISLTDSHEFGMFSVGSAVPQPELIGLVGAIGKILVDTPGEVVVRGHTDARPYRSESYDNWRLSTSRAHAAYFMLVKGGLEQRRIVGVAGFADRVPKVVADPLAPSNRRIELLLKEPKP